ncbi:hypothetical protein MES5069_190132 [Mesorhizobium escarrei]|uniref:Uncharacterized protein n=1 Tax=Mesorhizobium escarrei TaxID=666018 RepID=A0ABM9DPU0_9HYPH|nr:hypothetical protein MES5069_190132 [Mesorhizobium escarrei]
MLLFCGVKKSGFYGVQKLGVCGGAPFGVVTLELRIAPKNFLGPGRAGEATEIVVSFALRRPASVSTVRSARGQEHWSG